MAYEVLIKKVSDTGTRTQVARVKAEYPNQLDYIGFERFKKILSTSSLPAFKIHVIHAGLEPATSGT